MINSFVSTTKKVTTSIPTNDIFPIREEYTEDIRSMLQNNLNQFLEVVKKEVPMFYLYKGIEGRVKEIESMNRKLVTKNKHSWKDVSDYCGVQIIVHPFKNIKEIIHMLNHLTKKHNFKIVKEENILPKDSTSFGYRATHIDSIFNDLKVEIQIRTIFQDIWGQLSHQQYEIARLNGYDNAHNLPRDISQISSLLEISEVLSGLLASNHSQPIPTSKVESPDQMKLLFAKKFKYGGHMTNWEFGVLFEVSKLGGINSPHELEKKWIEFSKKLNNPPESTPNVIFKFAQYLFIGESFNPNIITDSKVSYELLHKFKNVLSNIPLI
ncbi:hypothetical protein DDB_G0268136 [Dictyostelium discoideum AX4]|uniref:RelA/SpoT domain-containing protein n=1 Tax=Dictyostelium discoideum TaxID=44689 RepID=Q55FF4_DICDI|nr:hypothetical protein DDB_G0268136 [Dictyostelium discoideum AX4]EAL73521.1 hypothetical protein DDB_G0268136 [Dictyostelium discoideum AX4]|eukprot:XP_647579.1 hypothetical protein DDB_G0268136 [Dictyostelium discoideum AX4]